MYRFRVAVLAVALGLGACSASDTAPRSAEGTTTTSSQRSRASSPSDGWQSVHYRNASFVVPKPWKIYRHLSADDYGCRSHRGPGVYLAPASYRGPAKCLVIDGHVSTLYVSRYLGGPMNPGSVAAGKGTTIRWVPQNAAASNYEVTFPRIGITMVFDEVSTSTRSAVVVSLKPTPPALGD